MKINDILDMYKKGEWDLEKTNFELKKANAGFYIDGDKIKKNPAGNWTEEEMKEGFIEGAPEGYEKYPKDVVLKRVEEFAGLEIIQKTQKGEFKVTYDDLGYAVKAVKV